MFLENGTLPMGVVYDGALRRKFTVRPLKVKDSLEIKRSPDQARCEADNELMGLALLGKRLDIEGVPREAQTLCFMEELFDDDLAEIMDADGRLSEEMARFRGEAAQTADSGFAACEDSLGCGGEDAGGGSGAVAGGLGADQEPEGRDTADLQGPAVP